MLIHSNVWFVHFGDLVYKHLTWATLILSVLSLFFQLPVACWSFPYHSQAPHQFVQQHVAALLWPQLVQSCDLSHGPYLNWWMDLWKASGTHTLCSWAISPKLSWMACTEQRNKIKRLRSLVTLGTKYTWDKLQRPHCDVTANDG